MDHGLELMIPILQIVEIEVFNILYDPGNYSNIGKRIFPISSYLGNIPGCAFAPILNFFMTQKSSF